MTFRARVYGNPVPWQRARVRRHGKFIVHHEQDTVRDWKRTIQSQVLPVKPERPMAGPLTMWLIFTFMRPKSLPKRVQHHTKRPDIDNLFKCLADALNGIVYVDDSQLVSLEISKRYGDQPGVEIVVDDVIDQRQQLIPEARIAGDAHP